MKLRHCVSIFTALSCLIHGWNSPASDRDTLRLTLDEVIALAQERSSAAQSARHAFLAAEWQYKYFKANYLPSVTMSSSPYLNKEINKITLPDGTGTFVKQNQLSTDLAVSIRQNVAPSGGSFFVKSSLSRLDEFDAKTRIYSSKPLTIGYEQSIFGYNSLKWDKKIEPVKYREAKKNYREAMELVAAYACGYFFGLVEARSNLDMARLNFASADTLYRMAQGRYKMGTINVNDMLQLEINRLNEETACMDAEVNVEEQTRLLTSYLGLGRNKEIVLMLPETVPDMQVPLDAALELAMENGSDPDYYKKLRLESESRLAQAKANSGLRADLYVQFGLSQTGTDIAPSYKNPMNQELVSVTLSLPILDWGRGRGRVKVAKSQLDLTNTQADQAMKDFEQNITKLVMQFNMQGRKVDVARQTSNLAMHRYDMARKLYISGHNTILDLNAASTEKDKAMRSYISSIRTFWTLFYTLRSITGSELWTYN